MVMGKLSRNVQSAFLKGMSILDGVLVANEVVDFLKKTKRKGLIIKVDFEKAYDSVDWEFLLDGLENMGFGKKVAYVDYIVSKYLSDFYLGKWNPYKGVPDGKGAKTRRPLSVFSLPSSGQMFKHNGGGSHGKGHF